MTGKEGAVMMNHYVPRTEETMHYLPAMVYAGPTNR